MTPDQIASDLERAHADEREITLVDHHGVVTRALVVAVDGEHVVLLQPGDTRPTAPIPLASIARVRVLDVASTAARRALAVAREGQS